MRLKVRYIIACVSALCVLLGGMTAERREGEARAQAGAQQPAPQVKAQSRASGGLYSVSYDTLLYGVTVHLPDDMTAGDTVSGTVIVEPKGQTEAERARNMAELDGSVLESLLYTGDEASGRKKVLKSVAVPSRGGSYSTFTFDIPADALADKSSFRLALKSRDGREAARANYSVRPAASAGARPANVSANDFQLPTLGQQGRPVEIFGPFDGNAANTSLNLSADAGAENVSGGITGQVLAESPRKAVFSSPTNVAGPVRVALREAGVEVSGVYRNVGVRMSAPKTNLMRGERTTLTVQLLGLAGLQRALMVQLDSRGVIEMDGGNFQNLLIPPQDVLPGGLYTATRTITGRQAGAFSATATVIVRPFDICLQDDANPDTAIMWNTFTGEYAFTLAAGARGQGGQTVGGSGTGKVEVKNCNVTLRHNSSERKLTAQFDSCDRKGGAKVQTSSPKSEFDITDSDTSDSACPSSRR